MFGGFKMTEDQVEKKYEDEFARYCFNTLEITHQDGYLRRLENGEFWDWLKEYHYDEWKALEDEDNKRMQMRVRSKEEEKELNQIDKQMKGASQ